MRLHTMNDEKTELDFRCIQTERHWQKSDFNQFQTTCFSDNKKDLTWLENRFLLPALVWQNLAVFSSLPSSQIMIVTQKCLNE